MYKARQKLRELRHGDNIHEYVKEFRTLMLQIGSLSAMMDQQEKMSDQAFDVGHIGSIRLFNAIKAKPVPKPQGSEGLMYMDALVNGNKAQAMVDTGETHNIIALDEAKRVGMKISSKMGGSNPLMLCLSL